MQARLVNYYRDEVCGSLRPKRAIQAQPLAVTRAVMSSVYSTLRYILQQPLTAIVTSKRKCPMA